MGSRTHRPRVRMGEWPGWIASINSVHRWQAEVLAGALQWHQGRPSRRAHPALHAEWCFTSNHHVYLHSRQTSDSPLTYSPSSPSQQWSRSPLGTIAYLLPQSQAWPRPGTNQTLYSLLRTGDHSTPNIPPGPSSNIPITIPILRVHGHKIPASPIPVYLNRHDQTHWSRASRDRASLTLQSSFSYVSLRTRHSISSRRWRRTNLYSLCDFLSPCGVRGSDSPLDTFSSESE